MSTPTLVILIVCFASIALADDFKTINRREFKNATISRVEPHTAAVQTEPDEKNVAQSLNRES